MKKVLTAAIISFLFFIPATAQAHHFPDLPDTHWAYHSIHTLSAEGILNGYSNGTFKPDQKVNRAQAAIILARALDLNLNTSFKPDFKDIPSDHYAYGEIAALTEKGVFANVSRFNPDQPLPRSQMAKIIIEGFDIIVDSNHQIVFYDVPANHWAHDYITTMAETGLSFGMTPTMFQPDDSVTRAQLAAFTDRAMQFNGKVKTKAITYDSNKKMYSSNHPVARDTISMVNQTRSETGAKVLKEDPVLSKIAQLKAEDMVNNNYFAHVSPSYGKPWEMALQFGYPTNQVGENIAVGYSTADEVMAAWLDSPGHKKNILREDYTVIGIGYAEDEDSIPYWVHMFAIN